MPEKIAIVIPAYNEAANISQVIAQVRPFAAWVIVVDDGSKDATNAQAQAAGAIALRHKVNRGQGAALQTGNQKALALGAQIIVHFDGDGQFLADEIKNLIQPIESGEADIILGSRFLRHTNQHKLGTQIDTNNRIPFFKKYFILPAARVLNYFLTGLRLTDAHCGLRAMNRMAAEKIKIEQDGMAHNTEIVAEIKKNNLRWREVPVTVIYHEFGQGVGGGFKILKELLVKKMIK